MNDSVTCGNRVNLGTRTAPAERANVREFRGLTTTTFQEAVAHMSIPTAIEWQPLDDCPGYAVSDHGEVLSRRAFRILTPFVASRSGHLAVDLPIGRRYVHRLVLETFIGPCPEGMEACHDNGDPADNRLGNLRWDTRSENVKDAVRHGVVLGAANAAKTHCPQGHEYDGDNTYTDPQGRRRCRRCKARWI